MGSCISQTTTHGNIRIHNHQCSPSSPSSQCQPKTMILLRRGDLGQRKEQCHGPKRLQSKPCKWRDSHFVPLDPFRSFRIPKIVVDSAPCARIPPKVRAQDPARVMEPFASIVRSWSAGVRLSRYFLSTAKWPGEGSPLCPLSAASPGWSARALSRKRGKRGPRS